MSCFPVSAPPVTNTRRGGASSLLVPQSLPDRRPFPSCPARAAALLSQEPRVGPAVRPPFPTPAPPSGSPPRLPLFRCLQPTQGRVARKTVPGRTGHPRCSLLPFTAPPSRNGACCPLFLFLAVSLLLHFHRLVPLPVYGSHPQLPSPPTHPRPNCGETQSLLVFSTLRLGK